MNEATNCCAGANENVAWRLRRFVDVQNLLDATDPVVGVQRACHEVALNIVLHQIRTLCSLGTSRDTIQFVYLISLLESSCQSLWGWQWKAQIQTQLVSKAESDSSWHPNLGTGC